MKSYILMGHGMMQMTEELLKDWNGGNVILNPRVLKEEQLISCSQTYKKNNATVLFDPHFYVPKSDKPILNSQRYWFKGEYSTNIYTNTNKIRENIKIIKEYNDELDTEAYIFPNTICSKANDIWFKIQRNWLKACNEIMNDKKRYATLCVTSKILQDELQLEKIIAEIENWDVDGFYIIPEHPKGEYLAEEPLWLSNLLNLCATLKLRDKEIIVSYANHQLYLLSIANIDGLATGNYMNVRAFDSNNLFNSEDTKRKSTWYYCPNSLSEYKRPFLDIAYQTRELELLKPNSLEEQKYSDILFRGAQPSTTNFNETMSFKHYINCFKYQVDNLKRSNYEETYAMQEMLLNKAEQYTDKLRRIGIRGQKRDFYEIVDVNRAAMTVFNSQMGFNMKMGWK